MISKFLEITGYALADSVNPCAIAVLTMVLLEILINNPEKRKKVLYGGLAFVGAVFIGYMVYAGILYQFFHSIAGFFANNSRTFKIIFGGLAIILGGLNIKDFFHYRKGGIATEMPLSLRPRVKSLIKKVTSPKGAFVIGFFVTLFLLPCTAGPLIIATGRLSDLSALQVLPWLLYYTFVFVLPMLTIVGLIYYGFTRVQEVSGWKEMNVKKLHLIAGLLLIVTGIAILVGWL